MKHELLDDMLSRLYTKAWEAIPGFWEAMAPGHLAFDIPVRRSERNDKKS